MYWNYRIVNHSDGSGFGLYEVFYNDKNEPESMGIASFCTFKEEGSIGITKWLQQALDDTKKYPIFNEPKNWE